MAKRINKDLVEPIDSKKYLYKEMDIGLNVEDSLLYLVGPLEDYSSYDFITKCRTILKFRESKDTSPINVLINSPGGCMYEMFSIIDYMNQLEVKINIACRGFAMSAAAMVLACGTGKRSASRHSTIMLHEGSAWNIGKNSDIQASAKHSLHMESMANNLLENKTKKNARWWKKNTRTDLFLSAEEALDFGIIDEIL